MTKIRLRENITAEIFYRGKFPKLWYVYICGEHKSGSSKRMVCMRVYICSILGPDCFSASVMFLESNHFINMYEEMDLIHKHCWTSAQS